MIALKYVKLHSVDRTIRGKIMKRISSTNLLVIVSTLVALSLSVEASWAQSIDQRDAVEQSRGKVPLPPWGSGDELGMANAIGSGTWGRCAWHLNQKGAKSYEISHIRSNTMPQSPFGIPLKYEYTPTKSIPYSKHAFNDEVLKSGQPGAQGTQMDALGHFGVLPELWKGKGPVPSDKAKYYGGYSQKDVKPSPSSPLLKLGIDKVPPIVTSAVLLDARAYLGGGQPMKDGAVITAKDIDAMIKAQGLDWRGILPGDVLYIYTGWSDNWSDPDMAKVYYSMGPGLSFDAAKYIQKKGVTLLALDNPFTDPAAKGMIFGKAPPAKGTPPGLPFAVHHYNLSVSGIHQIQNANLKALAADKVWTSCTIILPLRSKGGAGSPVRPVAIGVPQE